MKKQLLKIAAIAIATLTGYFQEANAQTNTFPATGSVGVGTLSPNASALVDLTSTTQGFLLPRMTGVQRNAIVTPATGLQIYQTDGTKGVYMYNGAAWVPVTTSISNLSLKTLGNLSGVAINASLTPAVTNSVDLGSATKYWKDLYLSGNANVSGNTQFTGTVSVGGNTVLNSDVYVSGNTTSAGNIGFNNSAANTIQFATPLENGNAMINMFPSGFSNPNRMVIAHSPAYQNWGLQYQDSIDQFNFLGAGSPVLSVKLGSNTVGIGTSNPKVALSFPAATGKKISLYPGGSGDVGMGVYGNEFRLHTDYSGADITFGYDNFTNGFTERMRVKGDGKVGIGTNAPGFLLDVNGRLRLRNEGNGTNLTAGIWYNKMDNSGVANFVGNYNDSLFGIYGSTSGWRFFFDHKNGNLGIGTGTPKVALSFPAATGKKISLYPGGSGDVGMGVYGNEFRLHSDYSGADITFGYDNYTNGFTERMRVKGDGRVCIGTTSPANGYLLSVNGKVIATEVRVDAKANWPDYVFSADHKLLPLEELETSINTNKHLPGIPSATEVKNGGIMLGDMQTKTMEKVEELTLYLIQLNKENKELKARLEKLENK